MRTHTALILALVLASVVAACRTDDTPQELLPGVMPGDTVRAWSPFDSDGAPVVVYGPNVEQAAQTLDGVALMAIDDKPLCVANVLTRMEAVGVSPDGERLFVRVADGDDRCQGFEGWIPADTVQGVGPSPVAN